MKKLLYVLGLLLFSVVAVASEGEAGGSAHSFKYFAYFFAVAIAAYGGTTGQSRAAAASLEGIARNPGAADKVFTPMLLSFAMMESLVIFTLISVYLI